MTKTTDFHRWAAAATARPVPIAGELEAMREGLGELLTILSWSRPHDSQAERDFVRLCVLKPLKALRLPYELDGFGNVWVTVAPAAGAKAGPSFLWSCHVDTVASKGGRQEVQFAADGRTVELAKRKPGRCLGADDGAGVWLLLEMIRAGVAGSYVFHRGEEVGRLGSLHVVRREAERLCGFDACVAFDRRDYADLITHQMGERCASELFSSTFGGAVNSAGVGLKYESDPTGSFTDSYSYADQISECCNLSVGYDSEHGPRETLDALHLWRLRDAMVAADLSCVVCERDPSLVEFDDYGGRNGYGGMTWGGAGSSSRTGAASWRDDGAAADDREAALRDLVERYPGAVVDLLNDYGIGASDLADYLSPSEYGNLMAAAGGWAS
jgi:hypothetical protein